MRRLEAVDPLLALNLHHLYAVFGSGVLELAGPVAGKPFTISQSDRTN